MLYDTRTQNQMESSKQVLGLFKSNPKRDRTAESTKTDQEGLCSLQLEGWSEIWKAQLC